MAVARKTTKAEPVVEKKYFLVDRDGDVRGQGFDSIAEAVEYSDGCGSDPYEVFEAVQVGTIEIGKASFIPLA